MASPRPASPPSAAARAANSTQRANAVGHCPGTDGGAAGALPSDAGAGPTANRNWPPASSPSLEMTCQLTVYAPSGRRLVTGMVTTRRTLLCRAGPSAIRCTAVPVSVTGIRARVTGWLNVSVIAFGVTGTALSAAGEVNRSVACAQAAGAAAIATMPVTVSAPTRPAARRIARRPLGAAWLIRGSRVWQGRSQRSERYVAGAGPGRRQCPRRWAERAPDRLRLSRLDEQRRERQ